MQGIATNFHVVRLAKLLRAPAGPTLCLDPIARMNHVLVGTNSRLGQPSSRCTYSEPPA